jgi:hypothetical protein
MDSVNRLAKGFGVTGKIVQANSVVEKAIIGFQDGNWKPLLLEFESIAAGAGAGMLVALIAPPVLAAFSFPPVIAVVATGLLVAGVAALLDAKTVEKINDTVFTLVETTPAH